MSFVVDLPLEMEQKFLAETQDKSQSVIKELVMDYLDKKERQKRREELLKNPSPLNQKYAGFLKKTDGTSYTDDDIKRIKDEYLTEKYGM